MGTIIRATAQGEVIGMVQTRNVFTYSSETADGLDSVAKNEIKDGVHNIFNALRNWTSNLWHLQAVQFEVLDNGIWQPAGTQTDTLVGLASGEVMPAQVALLMTAYTGVKKTIGKKYFPSVPETIASEGIIVQAALSDLVATLAYYLSTLSDENGDSWVPGTVSKAGSFHPFTSGIVRDILSTQRRRKPGVGI